MYIYLIRHGQTTGDVENRYGGDYDDHMTELGIQQAMKLAVKLQSEGFEKLYFSPLMRARETAEIIAKQLSVRTDLFDPLRERNSYGILTGMTKEEALTKYPDQVALLKDPHNTIEGAEDYKDFQQRITQALQLLSKKPFEKIGAVTHGGPIRLIFRDILKLGETEIDDCAFVVLNASESGYKLIKSRGIVTLEN